MTRSKSISTQPYEYIEIFQYERQVQALATNLETNYKQNMKRFIKTFNFVITE